MEKVGGSDKKSTHNTNKLSYCAILNSFSLLTKTFAMKFTVPRNILFMIFTFVLLDIVMQMQVLTFSALAELVNQMNNYTLSAHFGITPTETR